MATTFVVDITPFADFGYIKITWTNAGAGTPHYSYRVYRRITPSGTWVLLYETFGSSPFEYHDNTAAVGYSYNYAVVQVTNPGGVITEETKNPSAATGTLVSGWFWILHPTNSSYNFRFRPTADSFKDEYDQSVHKLIGRGRKIDVGTNWGKTGSITIPLRDDDQGTALEKRHKLEDMKATQTYVTLKNPFGDVDKVAFGDITFTRIAGAGGADSVDAQIDYFEVA